MIKSPKVKFLCYPIINVLSFYSVMNRLSHLAPTSLESMIIFIKRKFIGLSRARVVDFL